MVCSSADANFNAVGSIEIPLTNVAMTSPAFRQGYVHQSNFEPFYGLSGSVEWQFTSKPLGPIILMAKSSNLTGLCRQIDGAHHRVKGDSVLKRSSAPWTTS